MTFKLIVDPVKIVGNATDIASKVIRKVTYDIHGAILDRIRLGPKTGRRYRRRDKDGRIRIHQASAAGESPATDHGFLIGSVQVPPFTNPLVGEILVAANYAEHLEYGAPRAHIEKRPFVKPAIEGVISRLQSLRTIT
jgi:hypothetical protein